MVSGGTGVASWEDETGVERELELGEISTRWLENGAEQTLAKHIGEEITIEVIDLDEE